MSQPASKSTDETLLIENLPFETDAGIGSRASIGLIVLSTDYTIEYEWRRIFNEVNGVALYHTRVVKDNLITPDNLRAMAPRIVECARVITPSPIRNAPHQSRRRLPLSMRSRHNVSAY